MRTSRRPRSPQRQLLLPGDMPRGLTTPASAELRPYSRVVRVADGTGPARVADARNAAARRRRLWRWLLVGTLMLAAGLGLDAVWIHARAALAQLLHGRIG